MQNIPHFLFQVVSINEGLVRCSFDISTQATGILQCLVALVFLFSRWQRGGCQPVKVIKCIAVHWNALKRKNRIKESRGGYTNCGSILTCG